MAVSSKVPGRTSGRGGTKQIQSAFAVSAATPNVAKSQRRGAKNIAMSRHAALQMVIETLGVGTRMSAIFNAPNQRTDPTIACIESAAIKAGSLANPNHR